MSIKKIFFGWLIVVFVSSSLFVSISSAARPKPESEVVYTAPITLYWQAKSGIPEAIEYSKYIDATSILKPSEIAQYERIERINKIYHEIRYKSLNDFIESESYTNVLDLGCGVSPRCLYMSRKEINYVGTDLKDVVNVLNIYAPHFLNNDMKKYVKFVIADAANHEEMLNSAKDFNGKICIVEDGLLMYLSRDKQRAMLESIRDILKKHGGCFVTSDFVAGEIFMSVNRTIYGDSDALILAKETQKIYENLSQILFNDTMFKTTDEAVNFIESAGLKVEMRPIFENTPDIISIRDLNNGDIEKINAMMQKNLLWVITVADEK